MKAKKKTTKKFYEDKQREKIAIEYFVKHYLFVYPKRSIDLFKKLIEVYNIKTVFDLMKLGRRDVERLKLTGRKHANNLFDDLCQYYEDYFNNRPSPYIIKKRQEKKDKS